MAGLSAPGLAGAIFDASGSYGLAVALALSGALLAALVSLRLPPTAAEAVDAT